MSAVEQHHVQALRILAKHDVPFVLIGGVGLQAHGFHSRVRDELLNVEQFACLAEARVLIDDWQEDYNHRRPHSALGMRAPAAFAAALDAPHRRWLTTPRHPARGRRAS